MAYGIKLEINELQGLEVVTVIIYLPFILF